MIDLVIVHPLEPDRQLLARRLDHPAVIGLNHIHSLVPKGLQRFQLMGQGLGIHPVIPIHNPEIPSFGHGDGLIHRAAIPLAVPGHQLEHIRVTLGKGFPDAGGTVGGGVIQNQNFQFAAFPCFQIGGQVFGQVFFHVIGRDTYGQELFHPFRSSFSRLSRGRGRSPTAKGFIT